MERLNENKDLKVQIEYCGACDYGGHCLALANAIKKCTPNAVVLCKRGRQGSFEILINDKLIYSKLQTMALPDYEEVVNVVSNVSKGDEPKEIKGQQPINCAIS
ncbi:PREDICTED: migration and invasion enhancer 1 [Papilio xuthus]|uniref:Migration and invasion enhancer 1 n=1 Tax=Papilio xuthus TaxID=66420 RepID=A0AAJ6Z459_PAPXU|nr:PREDICTED: migration and invasion enhancer 1 [Papilio xuthus]